MSRGEIKESAGTIRIHQETDQDPTGNARFTGPGRSSEASWKVLRSFLGDFACFHQETIDLHSLAGPGGSFCICQQLRNGPPENALSPPRAPQEPPRAPQDLLETPRGPPGTPQGPPRTPQGRPEIAREPPGARQGRSECPQGCSGSRQRHPGTPQCSP